MLVTNVVKLSDNRFQVFIDNERAFPLYGSEIGKYGLNPGESISDEIYDNLRLMIISRIKERIMYLIDSYERSERDIFLKLTKAGYSEDLTNAAISDLKTYGYIDDVRFAQNYAASLRDNRGKSRREIQLKLMEKGIDKDIIFSVLDDYSEDESELIKRALLKKGINIEEISSMDYKEKNKLYMFLSRRGFSSETIRHFISAEGYE